MIAAKSKNQDNKLFQKVVDIYQSKETEDFIEKTYKGNYIPTFITLDELATYKETYSVK